MASKIKPCPKSARHKWSWLKNTTNKRETFTSIQLTSVSLYKCDHCGAIKQGPRDPNH